MRISGLSRWGLGSIARGTSRWFPVIGVCGVDPLSRKHGRESDRFDGSKYVATNINIYFVLFYINPLIIITIIINN